MIPVLKITKIHLIAITKLFNDAILSICCSLLRCTTDSCHKATIGECGS